jgi:hypothetical protein
VRRTKLGTLAVALLALGCSGSTEPGNELQGRWQLVTVNGHGLPAVYETRVVEGRSVDFSLHDGQLEFRTRNRAYDIRELDFAGLHTDTVVSAYAVEGTRLLVMRTATPALAAYTDSGTIDASTVTLRVRHLPGAPDVSATLTYVLTP